MSWSTYDIFTVVDLTEVETRVIDLDKVASWPQVVRLRSMDDLPAEGFVIVEDKWDSVVEADDRFVVFATRDHAEFAAQALQQKVILDAVGLTGVVPSPTARAKAGGGSRASDSGFGWFLAGFALGG